MATQNTPFTPLLHSAPVPNSDAIKGSLTFDESTHTYYWNGVPIISVTQAIKAAGLIDPTWYTDFSRERGRMVHLATQFDDEGDLDEDTLSPIIKPYVLAARRFREDTGFIPQMIEARICVLDHGYAGTLDRYGLMAGKRKALVDYKTGVVQDWTRMQTAAYSNALPNGASFERYGVQLKQDGTYKMISFPVRDYRNDFNDFKACLRVSQMQQQEALCQRQ
jgi:hypothetical protein